MELLMLLLFQVIYASVAIPCFVEIYRKAGFNRWIGLWAIIPPACIILVLYLACSNWGLDNQ